MDLLLKHKVKFNQADINVLLELQTTDFQYKKGATAASKIFNYPLSTIN